MGRRRISVEGHLSTEELQQRYRRSGHPSEKTHWQVLWLIAQGKGCEEGASATGYTMNWVGELVVRYNRGGPEAVLDGRRGHSGRRPLLSEDGERSLREALGGSAPGGGLWSGPEVGRWLSGQVGRELGAHPDAEIELWAMHEHRVGLIPILRRVWAPRGRRPRAVVRPRYEWLYLVAFVHPESGR